MKRILLLLSLLPTANHAGNYIDYPAVLKTAAITSAASLIPTTISFLTIARINKNYSNKTQTPRWKGVLLTDALSISTCISINAALGKHYINPAIMGTVLLGAPMALALNPYPFVSEPKETQYSNLENFILDFSNNRDMLREYLSLLGIYDWLTNRK